MRIVNVSISLIIVLLMASIARGQTPLGSAWTYQGELELSGSPVNGFADLQFRLWNALSGGGAVSSTITRSNVPVDNGLFTVDLDFGVNALNGEARWMEIAVRSPAGFGTFNTLTPRQPLNAAPYAIQTRGIFVNSAGEVGIGTTNPFHPLDVAGRIHALEYQLRGGDLSLFTSDNTQDQAINFRNSGAAYAWRIYREDAGGLQANLHIAGGASSQDPSTLSNFLTMKNSGNIGIGTESPLAALHVSDEPAFPGGTLAVEGTTHAFISFFPQGVGAGRKGWIGYGSAGDENISIANDAGGDINLIGAGNVGIGTGSPQARLDVAGTTRTQILTITGGSDIAEPYDVNTADAADPDPGMVVSIDPDRIGELCIATEAYDTTVAGVISGANGVNVGLLLTQEGSIADGKHPVAMNGRVWTWCDADAGGPIKAGDLLTTSDTPGHAMKAADRQRAGGATIGKAMSSLETGRGLVLVLVNLQ